MGHAQSVQRRHVGGRLGQHRPREAHRLGNRLIELRFVRLARIHFRAAQKGVAAGHQFRFQRAGTKKLAVQQRLR